MGIQKYRSRFKLDLDIILNDEFRIVYGLDLFDLNLIILYYEFLLRFTY